MNVSNISNLSLSIDPYDTNDIKEKEKGSVNIL